MTKWVKQKSGQFQSYLGSEVLSFPQLTKIVLPVLWEQAFLVFVSLFSIWLLSFDGENAVSIVNMIAVVNKVFTSASLGIATGGTVLVAQNVGAGRKESALRSMAHTMGMAVVLSAIAGSLLLIYRSPFIGYLLHGASETIVSQAIIYFTGFCLSFPFYAFYQSFAGAMRGWGQTRIAWWITLAVNCVELMLIAIFLLGCGWGVWGLVAAMTISRFAGACLAVAILLRNRSAVPVRLPHFLRVDRTILRGILIIAIPLALEQFFFNSGKAMSQRFIAGYGTAHMAANGVVNAIFDLINLPQISLREALVTVVGICIGYGRPDLAKRYVYRFMRTIRMAIVLLAPITIPASALLIAGYGLSAESNQLTVMCLALIYTFGPLFIAGSLTIPAGLRAGGDATYVSVAALVCMWGVRVTLSYLFAGVLRLGVVGINLAMVIEWTVRNYVYRFRLKGSRWHSHQLLAAEESV